MFLEEYLEVTDPVMAFDRYMGGIEIEKNLRKVPKQRTGRNRYNPVNMLKTVVFGFMEKGYISLRELEDSCKVNVRYMYLMDWEKPSYRTFGCFISEVLAEGIEELFAEISAMIFRKEHVDLNHLYIDGTKLEANANRYSWVWKKATEKSRYRLYGKITALLDEINEKLQRSGLQISTNEEYVPEYLEEELERIAELWQLEESSFVHGRGHRKSAEQRLYERLRGYAEKLKEYREKLNICGTDRNSYSKTDHSASFMRLRKDHMGNDQLLPAYNIQIGVADEYTSQWQT